MSVRAYRTTRGDTKDGCTFNVWNDEALMDFFRENGIYTEYSSEDGVGFIELEVDCLKKALKDFPFGKDDYRIEAIKADIKFSEKREEDFLLYSCY